MQSPRGGAGFALAGSPSVSWRPLHACDRPIYGLLTLRRGRSDRASSSSRASLRASAGCAADDSQTAVVLTTTPSTDPATQCRQAALTHADKHAGQSRPTRRPASDCIASLSWPSSQFCVAHMRPLSSDQWRTKATSSKVFSQHFLEHRHIHHLLSQQLLQHSPLSLGPMARHGSSFSASSALSFFISGTSMPPNLDRHL